MNNPLSILDLEGYNAFDLRQFDPQIYKQLDCPIHRIRQEKVSSVYKPMFPTPYCECLSIPYDDDTFERANRALENIFASIECLTATFDGCCCRWRLYYGTPKISDTMDFRQSIAFKTKNYVLFDLLVKVYNSKPNPNISEDNPWGVDLEDLQYSRVNLLHPRREFCAAEVLITRQVGDNGQDMLSFNFNRVYGCRTTALFILNELRRNMTTILEKTPLVLDSRLPLLKFAEGTAIGKEENQHVSRYLLNDLLIKEFCSFIPYRKFI